MSPGPLAEASGLINATPVGMVGFLGTPVPLELLRPDLWVADEIYRPIETQLIRAARGLGAPTLGGAGMNVFQAADSFHLFAGVTMDFERMCWRSSNGRPGAPRRRLNVS